MLHPNNGTILSNKKIKILETTATWLTALCWMKAVRLNKLHTLWHAGKAETTGTEKRLVVARIWGSGQADNERAWQTFQTDRNVLYLDFCGHYMTTSFPKTVHQTGWIFISINHNSVKDVIIQVRVFTFIFPLRR